MDGTEQNDMLVLETLITIRSLVQTGIKIHTNEQPQSTKSRKFHKIAGKYWQFLDRAVTTALSNYPPSVITAQNTHNHGYSLSDCLNKLDTHATRFYKSCFQELDVSPELVVDSEEILDLTDGFIQEYHKFIGDE